MTHSPSPKSRLLLLAIVPMGLGACTMVGGGVRPEMRPAPAEMAPTPDADDGERAADGLTARVVEIALESIGTPYEWGGTDANGFDCSGLIQFAYGKFGIRLPRVSRDQIRSGSPVGPEPALLRPGDVLGFSSDASRRTSHVGLYIGGDEFIHSGSNGVRVSTLRNPYWQEHLVAARRIVD